MLFYQLFFVLLIAAVLFMFGFEEGNSMFYAVLVYFFLFYTLRSLLTYNHRMGIRSYRRAKYQEAIDYFHKSGEFYTSHPSLDRLRFATLFSVSRLSYREIAETNAGFCYYKLGNFKKAKDAFLKAREINPSNPMVHSGLEAIEQQKTKKKSTKK